jgi:hypothetical protein
MRMTARLTSEAEQRLSLYDKYTQMEARGCTRPGFAQRLWQTEQGLLWPVVMQAPEFLKRQLAPSK